MENDFRETRTEEVIGHLLPISYTAYPTPGQMGAGRMWVPVLFAPPLDRTEYSPDSPPNEEENPCISPGCAPNVNGLHLNSSMERMIGSVLWVREQHLLSANKTIEATPTFTTISEPAVPNREDVNNGFWSYNEAISVLNNADSRAENIVDAFYLVNTAVAMGNTNLANRRDNNFCVFHMNEAHKKRGFKEYQFGETEPNKDLTKMMRDGTCGWSFKKDWLIPLTHDDLLQIQALYSSAFGQILWANKFLQFSELNNLQGLGRDGVYRGMISRGRNIGGTMSGVPHRTLLPYRFDDGRLMLRYEGVTGQIRADFYQWAQACSKMQETFVESVSEHLTATLDSIHCETGISALALATETFSFVGTEKYSRTHGFTGNDLSFKAENQGHVWALTKFSPNWNGRQNLTPNYFISLSHAFIKESEFTSHCYNTKFNTHPLFYDSKNGGSVVDAELVTLDDGVVVPVSMAIGLDLSFKDGVLTWYGETKEQDDSSYTTNTPIGKVANRCIPEELVFEERKPLVNARGLLEVANLQLKLITKDENGDYGLRTTGILKMFKSELDEAIENDAIRILVHTGRGSRSFVFGQSEWTEDVCVEIGEYSTDYQEGERLLVLEDQSIYAEDDGNIYTLSDIGYRIFEHNDGCYYTYEQPEWRHEYHSGPREDFRSRDTIYGIGFEVEKEDDGPMCSYDLDETDSLGWARESDGSLDDCTGFELVSPVYDLMTDRLDKDLENDCLQSHINAGYSQNCGGHINFSIAGKDGIETFRSISSFVPLIVALYRGRWDAGYSRIKRKPHQYETGDKYSAINVRSRMVEFRIFSAVKNVTNLLWRRDLMRLMVKHIDATPVKILGLLTDSRSDLHKHLLKVYNADRVLQITLLYAQLADDMYDTQKFTKDGNGLMFTTAVRSLKRKGKPQQLVLGFAFDNFTNLRSVFGSDFSETNKTSIDWVRTNYQEAIR